MGGEGLGAVDVDQAADGGTVGSREAVEACGESGGPDSGFEFVDPVGGFVEFAAATCSCLRFIDGY
ncbi:hypothetical protein BFN03_08695 [Rhodococcus sp. WMMA185]|nr:hypothetical protein BFN03_08695 [Rhodococcus sp. WMMA185]